MFARNANAVLILMLAALVSNGSLLLSPSLGPAQGHHLQEHQYRQSKRQLSFAADLPHRWLPYAKHDHDDDFRAPTFATKRHPTFDHSPTRPSWRKRNLRHDDDSPDKSPDLLSKNIASQHMLRTPRNHRTYDVPQIECPQAEDGMDRFACPTPDRMGRYRCIDDHVLCDGFIDCPNGEDEDRQACMFYKTGRRNMVATAVDEGGLPRDVFRGVRGTSLSGHPDEARLVMSKRTQRQHNCNESAPRRDSGRGAEMGERTLMIS